MPNNPVQVILNTKDYFITPEAGRYGPSKDFYGGRDQDFVEHRDKLLRQVASIANAFQRSNVPTGVIKVSLQHEALAKSHRPQRTLFPIEKRPCIGASKLGELYYHVTQDDVAELAEVITDAETVTRRKVDKKGKEYFAPSRQRSEVGAVASIELPAASDKRQFGTEEAISWLSDPRTSGAYFVELYSLPATVLPGIVETYIQSVTTNMVAQAAESGLNVDTFSVDIGKSETQRPTGIIGVRLVSAKEKSSFNGSSEDHSRLLAIFDVHPYIRRILLPPIVVAACAEATTIAATTGQEIPTKQSGIRYPKVGIIDGGFGNYLNEWVIGVHNVVAPEHQQTDHGAFIAGLLVGGQSLNGASVCMEPDGCELYDVAILPDADEQQIFETYYPKGVVDFLTELDGAVEVARREEGIRIFNMSLNLLDPVQGDGYGIVANLLDQIADKYDVIFVISAGNLRPSECRSEWPSSSQAALQHLASRTVVETVLQPAESSRSIAVGALNPPGCPGRVSGVPAAYTRRGPGLRVGVKPDVGHYGGALPDAKVGTGLKSWTNNTVVALGHGTSYAAPLVAKTIASLEARVSSSLTREMLLGLLVHGCEIPFALRDPELAEVARQFTGFGIPSACDEMLHTPDYAITLVFADVLHGNRELHFNFAWPKSLVNRDSGACMGDVRMTLVYRPLLNRDFGSEFVRVNIDARLKQEDKGRFTSRVKQAFLPDAKDSGHFEHELIEHGLKWWPIKVYRGRFPRGKGSSSNWRLSVESLLRSAESFPVSGIPFGLVVTIADIQKAEPVFNDLRLQFRSGNVQISDIQAATQVRIQP